MIDYKYNPSGMLPRFRYNVFSFALTKSSWLTFIRRSRSASNPASVHTALISAPGGVCVWVGVLIGCVDKGCDIDRGVGGCIR